MPRYMRIRHTLRISCLFLSLPGLIIAQQKNDYKNYVSLFDGKSFAGWLLIGKKGQGYLVDHGNLVCAADGGGNLFTVKEYSNFIFDVEFQVGPGANNGVGIRAPLEGDAAFVGMEVQILDDESPEYKGQLRPTQYHGSVYDIFAAKQGFLKKAGEWNHEQIKADGLRIQVILNGHQIVDGDLGSVKDPEVLKKHPGLARTKGHIGFLGHNSHVEFRNIRIRELP